MVVKIAKKNLIEKQTKTKRLSNLDQIRLVKKIHFKDVNDIADQMDSLLFKNIMRKAVKVKGEQ